MATSTLSSAFGDTGPRGKAFFDAAGFPHKNSLLHKKILMDGTCPSGPDLMASFGHPVPNIEPFKRFANDDHIIKNEATWMKELSTKFKAFNNKEAALIDRLKILEEQPVAAALGVYYKKGKNPVIAVITNPIITTPDLADAQAFGAPKLALALKDDPAKEFVDDPTMPTHCVVASLKESTRTLKMKETRFEMESDLLPVMLMEGDFYARQYNNTGLWTWLLLPDGCSPPVGLLWPTNTTYDEFVESIDHRTSPYKNFIQLLKQEQETVKAWFDAVNTDAAPFQIRIVSALQFWKQFPTEDVPEPDTVEDSEALDDYRVARNRFGDAMLIDWGLYGKSVKGANRNKARCRFWRWLTRADASYPIELNSVIDKTKKPFIGYLLTPESGWDFPEVAKLFDWNVEFEVPQKFQIYEPMEIGMHNGVFRAKRLEPTTDLDDLEEFQNDVIELAPPAQAPSPTQAAQNTGGLLQATPNGPTTVAGTSGFPMMVTPTTPVAPGQNLFGTTMQHQNIMMGGSSPMGQQAGQNLFGNQFMAGQAQAAPVTPGVHPFGFPPHGHHQASAPFAVTPNPLHNMYGIPTQWQQSPMAAMPGYQMLGALMQNPHKTPQYSRMEAASMATPETRKVCNPILNQVAILLATPSQGQLFWADGTPVDNTTWMAIREPSSIGKFQLSSHDDKKKNVETVATALRQALHFRAASNQEFKAIPMPRHSTSIQIATTTQKAMYNVTSWQIGRHTPAPTVGTSDKLQNGWHPFHLLPLVDPQFSSMFLPDHGLTQQQACQFGKILFLLMSLLGCEPQHNQDHDDSLFSTSYFGHTLKFLCMAPQNETLRYTWEQFPRNCTQHWMEDICETFNVAYKLVDHRGGADTVTMGIKDAFRMTYTGHHEPLLVIPNELGQTSFSNIQIRYPDMMAQLWGRFQKRWEHEVNPHDPAWRTPVQSNFYATAQRQLTLPQHPPPQNWENINRAAGLHQIPEKAAKKQRQQDRPQVVIAKPAFVCLADVPAGKHCYMDVLKSQIATGDSPLFYHPQGKTRHPLCLRSAFTTCNVCNEKGICQSGFTPKNPGIGRERLHVDFADPVWSPAQYPESNWEPLVKFVKIYQKKKLIGPSEWLKAVTPNTTWE